MPFSPKLTPMLLYALTIFLSAFLLFQVQPLIAKIILPWFGGSAAVWNTCMLFFQAALLGGYGYAHWIIQKQRTERQIKIHSILLGISILALPIMPGNQWKPNGTENPSIAILLLLLVTIGLPYFLLSTTSPLLQAWYSRQFNGAIPYRLFALSNFASLLALLSYPPLVEPNFTAKTQAYAWSGGYALFVLACIFTAWKSKDAIYHAEADQSAPIPPTVGDQFMWMGLSACASILLLAVTTHLTQDVAAIPFLWLIPLVLYLLTFILAFETSRFYYRPVFLPLAFFALGLVSWMLKPDRAAWLPKAFPDPSDWGLPRLIAAYSLSMFFMALACHGELARLKPHPRYLTSFYFMLSIGGAVGGVFVGLLAPNLFNSYYEFPGGLALTAILLCLAMVRGQEQWIEESKIRMAGLAVVVLCLGAFMMQLGRVVRLELDGYRVVMRNFYGQLRVEEENGIRKLMHGVINHGQQYVDPAKRRIISNYYCAESGVGKLMGARLPGVPQRVGIVGLGTGNLTGYARKGDSYRVYEINPQVIQLANSEFTYLKDAETPIELSLGDARLSLEREPVQNFDVLTIDAFSGDAVPVHLLTKEAFALYWKHMKPNGVLAVHISNKYLELKPVVAGSATSVGKKSLVIEYDETEDPGEVCFGSTWVLVLSAETAATLPNLMKQGQIEQPTAGFRTWTDDFSSMFDILKK